MAANQENAFDLSCADFNLSVLFQEMDEDDYQISPTPSSDANYAQELQFQEAMMASMMMINKPMVSMMMNNRPQNSVLVQEDVKAEVGEALQIYCEICAESKEKDQIYTVQNCDHVFCNDCIAKHVEVKLQSNRHAIECPAGYCEGLIEIHYCQKIVPKNLLEKWDALLCESSIQASQKFYCPFKDCSAMLFRDSDEVITQAECPSCFRLFCAQCSVPWHPAVNCEEFQSMNVDERGIGDLMLRELAEEKKWNRCPRCRYYVEKTEGCVHISCRCGFQFCYRCGDGWDGHRGDCLPRQPIL